MSSSGSSSSSDQAVFIVLISSIFILVALLLLFPVNGILPVDRRVASLFGAVLCTAIMELFHGATFIAVSNTGSYVDFDVLLVLTAIMAINFLLLRQPWLKKAVHWMQSSIRHDVDRGFYLVSIISFLASPFILNDGLCLMLVHPVLDAFVEYLPSSIEDDDEEQHKTNGRRDTHNPLIGGTSSDIVSSEKQYRKLQYAIRQNDGFYYCLAIACSANIGSVMTFSGNPQNLIVAQFLSKYMNCASFFALMFIPAVVSWLATIYLLNFYRKQGRSTLMDNYHKGKRIGEEVVKELTPPRGRLHTIEEGENESEGDHSDRTKNSTTISKTVIDPAEDSTFSMIPLQRQLSFGKDENGDEGNGSEHNHEDPYDPMSFPTIVFPLFVLLIVLEFMGTFGLGGLFSVLAMCMVGLVILANYYYHSYRFCAHGATIDSYSPVTVVPLSSAGNSLSPPIESTTTTKTKKLMFRSQYIPPSYLRRKIQVAIEELFHSLDYNLLIIFIGLFIVSGSFLQTKIPKTIWELFAGKTPFQSGISIFVLSIYIIVASQLVGNVPVVYMAKEEVQLLAKDAQIFGWLILAWVSTVAGNFTLVGSAANIIVVEKAMR